MNILMLSWRGPKHPNAGGAEICTHEHAKGWVRAGHSVILFTSAFKGGKKEEIIEGVKIIRRGRQIFGTQWEAFKWYLFGYHQRFDLVIDQFHGIPYFTPLYVRTKKLAFIHEVTKEVWRLNQWPLLLNRLVAFFGELGEPWIFKLFYKNIFFITVSESTKQDLIKWGIKPHNITIVHNGFRKPKIKFFPKEKKKTVIFLGALSKDKGIEDAILTFKELNNQMKDWQFWIAGKSDSNYLRGIKRMAKNIGILDRIRFFGYVTERRKYELLSRAHILLNPSIREGWGLVVIEAASSGTPCVGYDVPGLRDSILNNKTGIICKPDPISCSKAILSLVNDHNKYLKLKKNCIRWSKKFKWEDSYRRSLKIISRFAS